MANRLAAAIGPVARAGRLLLVSSLLVACSGPSTPTTPARSPLGAPPTIVPALGLTWTMAPDVELPADAFAVPADPTTGPAHPNTAGHPGHFPGQAVIEDVVATTDRLLAVGYVGLEGTWTALAWTSEDGLRWTLSSVDQRPGSFAEAAAIAGDGSFVVVGRSGREAAAWRSRDGVDWTPATVGSLVAGAAGNRDAALAERMTTVIETPAGLLAGGSIGPELGDRHARLWHSADGVTWQPIADDSTTFAGAEVADIAATPSGYIAAGRLGTGQRGTGALTWLSPDGSSWTRIDDPALRGGLVASVVTDGAGHLVAVGSDLDEREAVVWSSTDGRAWTRAPRETSRLHVGEKIRMTDAVLTPVGLVAVGNYVGVQFGTGTSWLSTDGLAWTQAPDQPTLGQAEPEAVIAWRDRLVIVGSRGAPDNYIPSVWLSPGLP